MAAYAHLFKNPIRDWSPRVGDHVAYRASPGAIIRPAKILNISGKYFLLEIKVERLEGIKTKKTHAEINELRPLPPELVK